MNVMNKDTLIEIIKSILGGACIALGTYFSKMCPYPILAPLLFSVGILMVMAFNLSLITRHVPTSCAPLGWRTLLILVCNLVTAGFLGFFAPQFSVPEMPLLQMFGMSVLGGIVIGLVSLNNLTDSPYKVVIALLLMYSFVMLGLPHCVVASFCHVPLPQLLIITVGNLLGGLILNLIHNREALIIGCKTLKKTLFGEDE